MLRLSQINTRQRFNFSQNWTASSSLDVRYKFTGKERDAETGLDYFGTRYYDSDLSLWLSVDPLSDARPNLSPYHYCQWNPMVRRDPSGAWDDWYMNVETGELYYNKSYSKEWIIHKGKLYRRIGDNNLMGDMRNLEEKDYNFVESQKLAKPHGFSINPIQVLVLEETWTISDNTGSPAKITTLPYFTLIYEKYGLFKSDAKHVVRYDAKDFGTHMTFWDFVFIILGSEHLDLIYRYYFTYLNDTDFKKIDFKKTKLEEVDLNSFRGERYLNWDEYFRATKGEGILLKYRYK